MRVDSGELLVGYYDAVHEQTVRYVERLGDADLARIVDRSWDPSVTRTWPASSTGPGIRR